METSLIIKGKTTDNKDTSKSLTNINPNATDANLYNFAVDFQGLSKNTFESVVRINKTTLTGGNA